MLSCGLWPHDATVRVRCISQRLVCDRHNNGYRGFRDASCWGVSPQGLAGNGFLVVFRRLLTVGELGVPGQQRLWQQQEQLPPAVPRVWQAYSDKFVLRTSHPEGATPEAEVSHCCAWHCFYCLYVT